MLAPTAHTGVERVYFELTRHPEWLWPDDPESRIPAGLVQDLFAMSDDVVTTVWLLLVWQEELVATDFVKDVDVSAVVADFREHAGSEAGARNLLAEEVDGIIEKARMFRDRISNMADNGVVVSNPQVRQYFDDKLDRMQDAWLRYRQKLQDVIGSW